MTQAVPSIDDIREHLAQRGITVPDADLPFLLRTRQRQLQVLESWADIPLDVPPALVFRPPAAPGAGDGEGLSPREATA
jgi:hypothetical protein